MKSVLTLCLFLLSPTAFSLSCPSAVLNCELFKINAATGNYESVKKESRGFTAVNEDEPSEAPNKCVVTIGLSTESGKLMVASVNDGLQIFMWMQKGYGAESTQFMTTADIGKTYEMISTLEPQTKMVCGLK